MFFSKKSHPEQENVAKKSVKKMDTVVTGMILWGIVASIYGVKKMKEKKDDPTHALDHTHMQKEERETPNKKQSIFSRIFLGNK